MVFNGGGTTDVNEGTDWAVEYAVDNRADLFVWDSDGMGISLKRQVRESLSGKKIDYKAFRGSEGAENPEQLYDGRDGNKRPRKNRDVFKTQGTSFFAPCSTLCHNSKKSTLHRVPSMNRKLFPLLISPYVACVYFGSYPMNLYFLCHL